MSTFISALMLFGILVGTAAYLERKELHIKLRNYLKGLK